MFDDFPSEVGGNVSRQSWVGTRPVRSRAFAFSLLSEMSSFEKCASGCGGKHFFAPGHSDFLCRVVVFSSLSEMPSFEKCASGCKGFDPTPTGRVPTQLPWDTFPPNSQLSLPLLVAAKPRSEAAKPCRGRSSGYVYKGSFRCR